MLILQLRIQTLRQISRDQTWLDLKQTKDVWRHLTPNNVSPIIWTCSNTGDDFLHFMFRLNTWIRTRIAGIQVNPCTSTPAKLEINSVVRAKAVFYLELSHELWVRFCKSGWSGVTRFTWDKLYSDLELTKGLKEWLDEYRVMLHPERWACIRTKDRHYNRHDL